MAMKPYRMNARSKRSKFSVGFEAADDKAAMEHVIRWAKKAGLAKDASVRIVRPDGSDINASEAVALHLDDLT